MTRGVLLLAVVLAAGGCGKKPAPPAATPDPEPVSPAPRPAPKADPAELAALKGTWRVTAITAGGKPVPAERVKQLQLDWVFDENGLATRRPDRPSDPPGRLTLDPTTDPKRFTKTSGDLTMRAVYRLDGKTLTVCVMTDENPNAGFPAGLTSTASPTTDLLILERR